MSTNSRTFFAVAAIISMAAITGCAGKKSYTGIDNSGAAASAAQTSGATPSTIATPAVSFEKSSGITGSGITDSSLSGDEASKRRGSAEGADTAASSLKTVYFDFDAFLLSAEARETLTGNARFLESNAKTQVTIEGHADERGSDEYNLALAEKRAVAVKRYLQSLGVSAERMDTVSFGEDKPAVEGDNEAAWSKNRRVDFVIVK
jgi:peptidoglycan-associated lipoprotein